MFDFRMKLLIAAAAGVMALAAVGTVAHAEDSYSYINEDYQQWCRELGNEYDIPATILIALIETESSGKPNAVSQNGYCKGLCQVNPNCHKDRMDYLDVTDIYDPYSNILVAVDYLNGIRWQDGIEDWSYILDVYNGNSKALANYKAGTKSTYSKKILKRAIELETINSSLYAKEKEKEDGV